MTKKSEGKREEGNIKKPNAYLMARVMPGDSENCGSEGIIELISSPSPRNHPSHRRGDPRNLVISRRRVAVISAKITDDSAGLGGTKRILA